MLIKEYRIPVPMTVDEYRIAQLYMIVVSNEQTYLSLSLSSSCPLNFQLILIEQLTFFRRNKGN